MPRYDTLNYSAALASGRRGYVSRDSEDESLEDCFGRHSGETTSTFLDNYQYAVRIGGTHTEARNFAIDYHRKFTAREATDNWDAVKGSFEDEDVTSQYDSVLMNERITNIVRGARIELTAPMADKLIQWTMLLFRQHGIDQMMNEENLKLCIQYCGDENPDEVKDIARAMGFTIRPNGSCNSMTRYRKQLQEIVAKYCPDMTNPAERADRPAPTGPAGPFSMFFSR